MADVEILQVENQHLQRELRSVNRENMRVNRENRRLNEIIATKHRQIAMLITTYHTEKMDLINSLECRNRKLMRLHQRLVDELHTKENRITSAPETDKVHGIAVMIRPLRQDGAHEIRYAANLAAGEDRDEMLGGKRPPIEEQPKAVGELCRDRKLHNPSETVHCTDQSLHTNRVEFRVSGYNRNKI
ncbi:hypothetical protein ON010_g15445 [Phytophthora cinnamomi]|nr:hypothetical protein ON010_g15445 [Phytophthora cinnamomi]